MAQLTDDCFAFSGPLLPVGRSRAASFASASRRSLRPRPLRLQRRQRSRACKRCRRAASICRRSTIPPSTATPCAMRDLDAERPKRGCRWSERITAGQRPRRARSATRSRRSAFSPARRCRQAPTPFSCRRTCAPDGDSGDRAGRGSRPAPIAGLRASMSAPERSRFRPGRGLAAAARGACRRGRADRARR